MNIFIFLLIGLLAGWIASKLMRGRGLGLVGDLVVGMVGAVIGGFLLRAVGIVTYGFVGELVSAVIGALVLLGLISLIQKPTTS